MLMCAKHWFSLRKPLRDAVWREYQNGQEISKTPTARYMAVQQLAVAECAFRPNDETAAATAAPYLLNAERWRQRAIAQGHGDPLEGLLKELAPKQRSFNWSHS